MKKLAAIVLILSASSAYAADAEIISNGLAFQEANGIMAIKGEVKNNTNVDFEDLKVVVDLKMGNRVVHRITIKIDELKAGEQTKIDTRGESSPKRWNNYTMAFKEGETPLFWRAPKKKK